MPRMSYGTTTEHRATPATPDAVAASATWCGFRGASRHQRENDVPISETVVNLDELAVLLGDGWHVKNRDAYGAVLENNTLVIGVIQDRDRLLIQGMMPSHLVQYLRPLISHEITVSARRPVAQVAAEIHRRLVPGLKCDLADAERRHAEAEALSQRVRAASDRLLALADGALLLRCDCEDMRRHGAIVYEEYLQAQAGSLVVHADYVRVSVDVPPKVAEDVLRLILDASQAPGVRAALPPVDETGE